MTERFLQGTPHSRQWLAALIHRAVDICERDCRRLPDGLRADGCPHVVGSLLAHSGLSEAEQARLIRRILGQDCRI